MSDQEENFAEILYNRLSICKRFPINQVVKISFPIDEVYSNSSIAIVKGYQVLNKDIDGLKAGEFVLEVESGFDKRELFKSYVVKPEFCTPINEEIYLSPLNNNSEKSSFIKQRLFISDDVHKENIDIVKQFRIDNIIEVEFSLSNHETEEKLNKNLIGKVVGYIHDLENKQKPGLFTLQVELFPMKSEEMGFALKQIIHVSVDCCKVI